MEIFGRTDLASEARSLWLRGEGETAALPGVRAESGELHGLPLTAVEILDARGAAALGKAPGRYYTLELPSPLSRGTGVLSTARPPWRSFFGAACRRRGSAAS